MGHLNDHLQPCAEDHTQKNLGVIYKELDPKAGSTKRKELHGTATIVALSGNWGIKEDGAVFYAYKLSFACNLVGERYSDFALLIESKLDDDVGNVEMDLYLIGKQVKATASSCDQVNLDHEQLAKVKCFQEFLFNGLFGGLFVDSKETGTKREFLLQTDKRLQWNPNYMYLLLPINVSRDCDAWNVNWAAIDSCISVVDFLKRNSLFHDEQNNSHMRNPSHDECEETKMLHFANGSFNAIEDMVVISVHTGRVYCIVKSVVDMSAESPFEGGGDDFPKAYSSYIDYFSKKYGIKLVHPKQPMLRLKQSHNPHNLLVNFNEGTLKNGEKVGVVRKKPQAHVHLPPELLIKIDIPRSILKSLYLLPSVMHRLESLMLASQLRAEINSSIDDFYIPCSLVLESISTLGCCEKFSMKRLELLGDSVLKYAVSCYLYLMYPGNNEGQLTFQRKMFVCNAMLHKLGTDRKLQGYIRDGAFDPRRWAVPGQRTLHPIPCKCGLDTLEVPMNPKYQTMDITRKVGKSCDMGHRWMGSKTISNCVEALIGAYYVSGGLVAALHVMKWFGIHIDLNPNFIEEAIRNASLKSYLPKNDELDSLEAKLGHKFSVRFLLQEAITHQSEPETYSYQRLEFLGDSVLDLLITQHLYKTYSDIDPGDMTDLRAASVNNENFAQVAVRKNLYTHLQHSSVLNNQIISYVKSFPDADDGIRSPPTVQGPKALSDLVESIAAALLLDTQLNLEDVWRVFEPLLSPLVTPDTLELPPLRALSEFCDSHGYFFRKEFKRSGELSYSKFNLQLEHVLLVGEGSDQSPKHARAKAAACLLEQIQKANISKRKRPYLSTPTVSSSVETKSITQHSAVDLPSFGSSKRPKRFDSQKTLEPMATFDQCCSKDATESSKTIPDILTINRKKGGPRITLFEFCKKKLWPMPTFETVEHKSRTPIEFDDGIVKRTGFSSFLSTITLHIPGDGSVVCSGNLRADKRSSYDSAVLALLNVLKERGKIEITQQP